MVSTQGEATFRCKRCPLQTVAMATHDGSCSPGSNCGLACHYKTLGREQGRWWWLSSFPDQLPSPESIALAAADMIVRDAAGHWLLTLACEQRRLDWVVLLSPQVKECDQQSVDNKTVLPPLFACVDAYGKAKDFVWLGQSKNKKLTPRKNN